ncbi:MAG: 2,3-bisphosphoglycerate-independent phosphoglycerate mutase [Theionarchaea archaeon]|nr:2,3-bisphosphoglycerate-independent phosphoglycerate mutase [Theionarchaea archaeon]MBU7037016.1 2,3-bisphosphoglycerate-independent phosphoglycerate mutase [Theionarchaea archaeon]
MILLMILDGWGISEKVEGNAIRQARTPAYCALLSRYPHTELGASGEDVGLPEGQMGNSEVGHMNLGAGRIVYQDYTRINRSIRDGSFFKKEPLIRAVKRTKDRKSTLHLMGLVSDGGVHSSMDHLVALLKLAASHKVNTVVHPFLDGRDVLPKSALTYIQQLKENMDELHTGSIGTVMGRYYAMDRDNRWRRTQRAYEALTGVTGLRCGTAEDAIKESYTKGETDEFVQPTIIGETINDGDSLIFFNFRPDRARQLTRAFVDDPFPHFERKKLDVLFVCMTEYEDDISAPVVFRPLSLKNTLGEVLSTHHLRQLRIAETEKYYHVTYFFNGGREEPFDGEDRVLIPSPKVATYDMQPEMSAHRVTARVVGEIESGKYDVIILNFANPDMVAHTGDLAAGIAAIETVDTCMGQIVDACKVNSTGNVVIVTGDHGNAEQMVEETSMEPFTAHTPNSVPFIITQQCHVRSGILADVAPTILDLLGIEKPREMDGETLIKTS